MPHPQIEKAIAHIGLTVEEPLTATLQRQLLPSLRKHKKALLEASIELPRSTDIEDDMAFTQLNGGWQVDNLTKGSSYTLVSAGGEWCCNCTAAKYGNVCSHVKALESHLKTIAPVPAPAPVQRPIAPPPPPAPVVPMEIPEDPLEGLTEDQLDVCAAILAWFDRRTEPFFGLTGDPGTGKSRTTVAIVHYILQNWPEMSGHIALCAPSDPAKKVLQQMAIDNGIVQHCYIATIHSLLHLTVDESGEECELIHNPDSTNPYASDFRLVIVDERSMVGVKLWESMQIFQGQSRTQFLFVGDINQLKPVKDGQKSPTFEIELNAHLTQVIRYGGAIGRYVRSILDSPLIPRPVSAIDDPKLKLGVIHYSDEAKWLDQIVRAFDSDRARADRHFGRVFAYTNARVDWLNAAIRARLVGSTHEYVVGETLFARSRIMNSDRILFRKAEDFTILDLESSTRRVAGKQSEVITIPTWMISTINSEGDRVYLEVPERSSFPELRAWVIEEAEIYKASEKSWVDFRQLLMSLCLSFENKKLSVLISQSWAQTTHGGQGATYKNVFVDMADILRCRESEDRKELAYVACSRGSDRLSIYWP